MPTTSVKMNERPSYPEVDEIEQDEARSLYEDHCAILIVEDLPVGSEFGIDMVVYRIGEKFRGVKMIPPGVHLIYVSAISKGETEQQQTTGPRCGFFHDFKPKEILIKKWSVGEEDFDDDFEPNEEYRERYAMNLRDLDRFLGPYKYSTYVKYKSLTGYITPEIMSQLMPTCNKIRSVPYLVRGDEMDQPMTSISGRLRRVMPSKSEEPSNQLNEESLLPDLKPDKSTVIRFTPIPETHLDLKDGSEISAEEKTKFYVDSSMKLEYAFKGESGKQRLLGELQFAFVTLTYYHVYDCFEQWKKLVGLVCQAYAYIERYPNFYISFIQILQAQLDQVPEDLFVDIVDAENLVRSYLDELFQNINETDTKPQQLVYESQELKRLAEQRFKWQFGLEREEEQPVVVEL